MFISIKSYYRIVISDFTDGEVKAQRDSVTPSCPHREEVVCSLVSLQFLKPHTISSP